MSTDAQPKLSRFVCLETAEKLTGLDVKTIKRRIDCGELRSVPMPFLGNVRKKIFVWREDLPLIKRWR